jgi:hypothetical protein
MRCTSQQQFMPQSMLHANALNIKAPTRAYQRSRSTARPLAPCRAASEPTPLATEAPSRGVLILPGLGNNAGDYGQLADALRSRGLAVEVAQVCSAPGAPVRWTGTAPPTAAVMQLLVMYQWLCTSLAVLASSEVCMFEHRTGQLTLHLPRCACCSPSLTIPALRCCLLHTQCQRWGDPTGPEMQQP